jgi:hypothetical protein
LNDKEECFLEQEKKDDAVGIPSSGMIAMARRRWVEVAITRIRAMGSTDQHKSGDNAESAPCKKEVET